MLRGPNMCGKPIKRMHMLVFIVMLKRTWQDQERLHMSIDHHGNLRHHPCYQPLIQGISSFQATWTSWEVQWANSHGGRARIGVLMVRVRTLRSHANCRQANFMLFTVWNQMLIDVGPVYRWMYGVNKQYHDDHQNCNTTQILILGG